MITNEEILNALDGLEKPVYDVHELADAWYSSGAMLRALGKDTGEYTKVIRVRVKGDENSPRPYSRGIIELHPTEDDKVRISCYCCFVKDEDVEKGEFALEDLKEAVMSLKDHNCPPWPG